MSASVTCKCVGCGHKETLTPIPSDVPMCSKCFSPMVVVSATLNAALAGVSPGSTKEGS